MSEKTLRRILVVGTVLFMALLGGMTVNTTRQVAKIRTPQLTDAVVAGKRVWQGKNCNDCHTILGIGGYFAPDLTKVMTRRGEHWLTSWLTNPQAMRPKTTMPHQHLTAEQVNNMVAFMKWVDGVDTNGWPPEPRVGAQAVPPLAQAGVSAVPPEIATLVEKGDCGSCHLVPGIPKATGTDAPSLCVAAQNLQAGKIDRTYLYRSITNPNADIVPGYERDVMPTDYNRLFTSQEIDSLVTFIAGLGCG